MHHRLGCSRSNPSDFCSRSGNCPRGCLPAAQLRKCPTEVRGHSHGHTQAGGHLVPRRKAHHSRQAHFHYRRWGLFLLTKVDSKSGLILPLCRIIISWKWSPWTWWMRANTRWWCKTSVARNPTRESCPCQVRLMKNRKNSIFFFNNILQVLPSIGSPF